MSTYRLEPVYSEHSPWGRWSEEDELIAVVIALDETAARQCLAGTPGTNDYNAIWCNKQYTVCQRLAAGDRPYVLSRPDSDDVPIWRDI